MLLLIILFVAALVSATMTGAYLVKHFALRHQAEIAAEAAALAAAQELSKIVIYDPSYGYISLSDYAPSAGNDRLRAEDGKPLPVTSINTLLAGARLNMLMAQSLNNEEYIRLARLDARGTREAARRLCRSLKLALGQQKQDLLSQDGKTVYPYLTAKQAFYASLVRTRGYDQVKLKNLKLELGNLADGCTTNTVLPQPEKLAELGANKTKEGLYKSGVDLPVAGESFIFCAVDKQARLVAKNQFNNKANALSTSSSSLLSSSSAPSNFHTSQELSTYTPESIVRAQVELEVLGEQNDWGKLFANACAVPYALADNTTAGIMIIGLPDGCPGGYLSLLDLINDPRNSRNKLELFRAQGGDYPLDQTASLQKEDEHGRSLSHIFIQGIFDWIRTCHGRVNMAALLEVLGNRIQPTSGTLSFGQSLIYRIKKDGSITVENYRQNDSSNQIVHDKQVYSLGLRSLPSANGNWTVTFRDQVRNLGEVGGKHAGQPMEIDSNLRPTSTLYNKMLTNKYAEAERKSYFDGGLAVEFVISTPEAI
jgi:hypothetical protein